MGDHRHCVSEARSLERDQVESDLTFAGFAVFNCPIRSDSGSILQELRKSSHDLVMITGDQALTACHMSGFEWVSPDETDRAPYSGDCFEMLQRTEAVLQVIPHVKVFARVAPEQKELVLTTFKTVGRLTLMCGDGTNDVGALKQAHVGIALLNAEPVATFAVNYMGHPFNQSISENKPFNLVLTVEVDLSSFELVVDC
ncbi:hypothetical protein GUJ93_ZPchr0481g2893 [Zizania palustris]|uniref:Uncharacterized protein n=1 Tax=Zizania palustris TaxID=103762 RepID=A0A8J5V319_ZIZPA|nr:hypothetical protein GUJ93_ZPchr0481g2893 [Zizania palustris]